MFISLILLLFQCLLTSTIDPNSVFSLNALAAHNAYRRLHAAPPLVANAQISSLAQNYADTLALTKSPLITAVNTYREVILGQNLASGNQSFTGVDATNFWYSGIAYYNYSNPVLTPGAAAFTQLVWRSTTDVGFGVALSNLGVTYVVAYYYPPGNIPGLFAANVF